MVAKPRHAGGVERQHSRSPSQVARPDQHRARPQQIPQMKGVAGVLCKLNPTNWREVHQVSLTDLPA